MKKINSRKLTLNRETLAEMTPDALAAVGGGAIPPGPGPGPGPGTGPGTRSVIVTCFCTRVCGPDLSFPRPTKPGLTTLK